MKKRGEQDRPDKPQDKSRFMARAEDSAHQKALLEHAIAARKAKDHRVRVAIDTVLKSAAGQTLFAHLFEICGYNLSNTAADRKTGDYQPLASAYNDARRSVYIDLRNRATVALLAPVELAAEEAQRQGE